MFTQGCVDVFIVDENANRCACVSRPVDVWAVGCLLMEMLTGQPLFPGDSDLDQIHHIIRCFGGKHTKHLSGNCDRSA